MKVWGLGRQFLTGVGFELDGPASIGTSPGGGPMETSLTDGWGVGVLTLLLMGEP